MRPSLVPMAYAAKSRVTLWPWRRRDIARLGIRCGCSADVEGSPRCPCAVVERESDCAWGSQRCQLQRGRRTDSMTRINMTVDGVSYSDEVEPRTLLVQYLRESLGKTGTVIGCDTSNCGACTVHLDGTSVKSCNVLAVQADGHEVTTIEGLATDGQLHPMQQAFRECHGLQCGFCTPGMIMQSVALLQENPKPTEEEIRLGLEGNLCRCTGYHNIVKAVQHASGQSEE